ncbi:UPF0058 family protein [Halomicroarcula sp. F13]|uniref:UPF0058 family protein n=1 Tax=Haloarcula rubra TaxID=2487747 RepID=A0AAW4Q0L0_9EURY|nr:UPF0058 family protein [Halomicroarcula rubra]MBX0326007.1 UPF0058 family protein [Halomicroarcula rubra]
MRKQELIHIHSLLVVTRQHLAEQADIEIPADAFDGYDDSGIGPTAIAERKDAHKAAVHQLLDGFQTTLNTHKKSADALTPSSESVDASPAQSS